MAEAICLRCGNEKPFPWCLCKECLIDPTYDTESLVKSVYLSTGRFVDPHEKDMYRSKLDSIGSLIKQGGEVKYDLAELARLRRQGKAVAGIHWFEPWRAVAKLFFVPASFLVALVGIIYALRFVKGV